eukprot:4470994-Pyramimonas_sp.AAC.1
MVRCVRAYGSWPGRPLALACGSVRLGSAELVVVVLRRTRLLRGYPVWHGLRHPQGVEDKEEPLRPCPLPPGSRLPESTSLRSAGPCRSAGGARRGRLSRSPR